MLGFTLKRLLTALPTLLLVSVAVFALVRAVPGDPASIMLGDMATEASVADLRAQMGLDKPIVAQFGLWIARILGGDLGQSIQFAETRAYVAHVEHLKGVYRQAWGKELGLR